MTVQIVGLDELTRKMQKLADGKIVDETLYLFAKDVKDHLEGQENYPPESEANRPPVPYYERYRGTQTASGNKGNSEQMGRQWKIVRSAKQIILKNTASYSGYVEGIKQTWYHKERGWPLAHKVGEQLLPRLFEIFKVQLNKEWR